MKATTLTPLIDRLRELWRREEDVTYTPAPPLNEDLSGLTTSQIRNEIRAVTQRLELGHVEPEGRSGLNYRLHRLKAQEVVAGKKELKENIG